MALQAIALLQLRASDLRGFERARVVELDDAVLVHTGHSFAAEPEQLAASLRALLATRLDAHRDPRGIFFLPEVAAPAARTYEAVIAEVGEGGVWAAPEEELAASAAGLELLLGGAGAAIPASLLASASAAAQGDPAALNAMTSEVEAMMGKSEALRSLSAQMAGLLGGMGGAEGGLPGPAQMEQVFAALQTQLAQNPDQLTKMVEQLFGEPSDGAAADDEDEDPSGAGK